MTKKPRPELVRGSFVSKRDETGFPVEYGRYAFMASPSSLFDEDLIRWAEERDRKDKR